MKIVKIKVFAVVAVIAMVCGCSTLYKPVPDVEPVKFKAQGYSPKYESMVIVIDTSSSMGENYQQHMKFDIAQAMVTNMAETIPPELNMKTILRSFGHDPSFSKEATTAVFEMDTYNKHSLVTAVSKIRCPGGPSPIGKALDAVEFDLIGHAGSNALIIVTDGKNLGKEAVTAAMELKEQFGETLCVYPVLIGSDPKGTELVDDLARLGECGFAVNADDLASGQQMADYVKDVFIGSELDMDGDGVPDSLDRCAGTSSGVDIDEYGCHLDIDGDGIPDTLDFCEGTPAGLNVDDNGCPILLKEPAFEIVLNEIVFDVGTADLTPVSRRMLDNIAVVMESKPDLNFIVEGHTDDMGSSVDNFQLSQSRANTVVGYLVSKGIPSSRLTAKEYGAERPVTDNTTWLGRAKNRRVQFTKIE